MNITYSLKERLKDKINAPSLQRPKWVKTGEQLREWLSTINSDKNQFPYK